MSPLHLAVRSQNLDIINILLDRHAEVNLRMNTGETALHLACKQGNYDIVKALTKLSETFVDI
jgi:uncharacterized protein